MSERSAQRSAGRLLASLRGAPGSPLLRWLLSLVLLGSVALLVDHNALLSRLASLSPGWLALALALTVPQVLLSAWRWRLTACHMGLELRPGTAVAEYYLATFLNQILPGGVSGDLGRAWRHGSEGVSRRAALRAVVIERASGQLALALVALVSLVLFAPLRDGIAARFGAIGDLAANGPLILTLIGVALVILAFAAVWRMAPRWLAGLHHDLHRTLWAGSLWRRQLAGSLAIVASYVLVFICCARALGAPLPVTTLLALTPLVLMAMAIPLSVAGWGIRESAAALVWILAGLPAQQGVAISVTYGAVVLVSSLPGAVRLLLGRWRQR
ncbi:lysylphosphatidylglycerol synthase transmembrane domain-containing protein [Kushneria aurantia]|uniref:YbhN family protein n=1 Tax=Kushneria aurantia TaxID=504092 RepID=A0ABV6FYL1_9GAMM|nr:lysylphosphatidylglycerol synthase transmembrane domain-containing protein [Kushneria aurantia]